MIAGLQYAAKHDKFLSGYVLRIPHEKLRFCMTDRRAGRSFPRITDSRVMSDMHDKSLNLPDPDTFTFDRTIGRIGGSHRLILCKSTYRTRSTCKHA